LFGTTYVIENGHIWKLMSVGGTELAAEGKRPLARPRHKWETINNMELKETGCKDVD
jgi:hypothetical protein